MNLTLKGYDPAYRLITLSANVPFRLSYAGNGVAPEDYDLARTLSGVDTAAQAFNEYRSVPSQDNPDFHGVAAPPPSAGSGFFPPPP